MKNFRFLPFCAAVIALVFLTGCVTSSGGGSSAGGGSIDDTARYLAGLSGSASNDLAISRNSTEWK